DYLKAEWDAVDLRTVIDESLAASAQVGAPTTWVLSNHDVVRHPSRYGLPEHTELPDDVRQDPTWVRSKHTRRGRDGCRVPVPWEAADGRGPSYGFNDGAATWLPQPELFARYALD